MELTTAQYKQVEFSLTNWLMEFPDIGNIMETSAPGVRLRVEPVQFDVWRRLPAGLAVFRHHIGEYSAAHIKFGGEAHEARLGGGDQIIQDAVGDILVKMPFIAERPDIQLETF